MSKSDNMTKKLLILAMKKIYNLNFSDVENEKTPDLILDNDKDVGIEITVAIKSKIMQGRHEYQKALKNNDTNRFDKLNKLGFYATEDKFYEIDTKTGKKKYLYTLEIVEDILNSIDKKNQKDYSNCKNVSLAVYVENLHILIKKQEILLELFNLIETNFKIIYLFNQSIILKFDLMKNYISTDVYSYFAYIEKGKVYNNEDAINFLLNKNNTEAN